jgi:hypothetical protein
MNLRRTPLLVELLHLAAEHLEEQLHQHVHLVGRTAPVLAGECKQGERPDAAAHRVLDGGTHRLDAGAMTRGARQVAALCPAAIAVHDHRDVARDCGGNIVGRCCHAGCRDRAGSRG